LFGRTEETVGDMTCVSVGYVVLVVFCSSCEQKLWPFAISTECLPPWLC